MKIKELTKKLKDAEKEVKKEARLAVSEVIADWFNKHPKADAVLWSQYTPYFCDGSPCEFGVNEIFVYEAKEPFRKLTVNEICECEGIQWGEPEEHLPKDIQQLIDSQTEKDIQQLIDSQTEKDMFEVFQEQFYTDETSSLMKVFSSNEKILELAFGDHCLVVIGRDGKVAMVQIDHD